MLTLQVEHRIDNVLQNARTGNGAFLGDVPDQEHGHAAALCQFTKTCRAFAHLRDRACRRFHLWQGHGLDRVDDHQGWLGVLNVFEDLRQVGFSHQQQVSGQFGAAALIFFSQAVGTHFDLTFGFLTRNVQDGVSSRQLHCHLQRERAFAYARIPTDQNDRARHDSPA